MRSPSTVELAASPPDRSTQNILCSPNIDLQNTAKRAAHALYNAWLSLAITLHNVRHSGGQATHRHTQLPTTSTQHATHGRHCVQSKVNLTVDSPENRVCFLTTQKERSLFRRFLVRFNRCAFYTKMHSRTLVFSRRISVNIRNHADIADMAPKRNRADTDMGVAYRIRIQIYP